MVGGVAQSTWALLGTVLLAWTAGALLVGVGLGRIIHRGNRHLGDAP